MPLDYGTTSIPSDSYTVIAGETVSISAAFDSSVGVIGGMDTVNGTATEGTVVEVDSGPDAAQKFGDGSELHRQVQMLFRNDVETVHVMPLTETQTTETFSATASGTLSNVPPMDPNVHTEHSITAVDDASNTITVNLVYDDPPSTPSDADTINLNPVTGDWEADASDTYDITYTYGDWTQTAVQPLVDEGDRMVVACTEAESAVNNVEQEVQNNADDFTFQHTVAGAHPFADPSNPNTGSYSDGIDTERVSLVAPSRGFVDDAETEDQRTVGAVAGEMASLALGLSSTGNQVEGLTGLRTDLTTSQLSDLIDNQVLPLRDRPPVEIVKDMTTDTEPKFERVYAMQVVDEATARSHEIASAFVGEQNTATNRNQLERSHRNEYKSMSEASPQMLEDYNVEAEQDSTNDDQVNLFIGIKPVDVMDQIVVDITVGDVVRRNAAT